MTEEVEEENKMLLQQLQQVQEELEFYYLEYSKLKTENESSVLAASDQPQGRLAVAVSPVLLHRLVKAGATSPIISVGKRTIYTRSEYQAVVKNQSILEKQIQERNDREQNLLAELEAQRDKVVDLEKQIELTQTREKEALANIREQMKKLNVDKLDVVAELDPLKNNLDNNINILAEENLALKTKLEEFYATSDRENAAVEELTAEKSDLQRKLQDSERERRLSLKMVAKHQLDLEDMRNMYSEKSERERSLIQLIHELREKLEAAAHFYVKLSSLHPELISEELEEAKQEHGNDL